MVSCLLSGLCYLFEVRETESGVGAVFVWRMGEKCQVAYLVWLNVGLCVIWSHGDFLVYDLGFLEMMYHSEVQVLDSCTIDRPYLSAKRSYRMLPRRTLQS